MLKVLVVEDEELIRKGIVLAVDWASLNCVVVGEAANGQEGLEQAARDAAVQVEADTHTQRAMWLMVCSIRQASRSAVWGSTPAATSWRVKKQCFS